MKLLQFPTSKGMKFSANFVHFCPDSTVIGRCWRCNRDKAAKACCISCEICEECHERKNDDHSFTPAGKWKQAIKPLLDQAVGCVEDDLVLSAAFLKINSVDESELYPSGETRSLRYILHGLLMAADDAETLAGLLELGANGEAQHFNGPTFGFNDRNDDQLHGARPIHFAAKHGRIKCLPVLLNAGVDLNAPTFTGLKAKQLEGIAPEVKLVLMNAKRTHPKSFAQLAKEGIWYAIRYRMRTHQVTDEDLAKKFDGKTAFEWVYNYCVKYDYMKADGSYNDSYTPFKVLTEIKYRYGEAGKNQREIPRMGLVPAPLPAEKSEEEAKAITADELSNAVTTVIEMIHIIQSDARGPPSN